MKKILTTVFLLTLTLWARAGNGAWGLYDYNLDHYQISYHTDEIRSIASITKLFTATTILREGLDLEQKVKVKGKSRGRFQNGQMVTRLDLMKAMLISSDNLAAETLANTFPGGFDEFIKETNRWIRGFGLIDTRIVDASGLLQDNVSTVNNLTSFLYKIKQHPEILKISAESTDTVNLNKGKKQIKIHLKNTNPEVFAFDNILLSKTGTTNAAGKCVVMIVEKNSSLHGIVILGQKNSKERSKMAQSLLKVSPAERSNEEQDSTFGIVFQ